MLPNGRQHTDLPRIHDDLFRRNRSHMAMQSHWGYDHLFAQSVPGPGLGYYDHYTNSPMGHSSQVCACGSLSQWPLIKQSIFFCEATIISYSIVNMLLNIVIAVFSALRAFAISGSKMLATLIVLSLGLVTVCASIYFMARSSYAYVLMIANMPVCDYHDYYSLDTFNRVIIASRICAIAADVIVIALTWYNTYKMRAISRQIVQTSLSTLIFRDGTIYFALLLFLNIMQMAVKSVGGAITNYAASFVAPVSSILISRFMINLRSEVYGSNSDSIVASIVGNMHSSLSYTASSDDRSHSSGSASLAYEEGSSEERDSITDQLVYDGDHPTSIELSDMYSRVEVV